MGAAKVPTGSLFAVADTFTVICSMLSVLFFSSAASAVVDKLQKIAGRTSGTVFITLKSLYAFMYTVR